MAIKKIRLSGGYDNAIEKQDIRVTVQLPPGTKAPTVTDNCYDPEGIDNRYHPGIRFYVLLAGMRSTIIDALPEIKWGDAHDTAEKRIDMLIEILRENLLDQLSEAHERGDLKGR